MKPALKEIFTRNEVELLEECKSFAFLFEQKNPGRLTQSQKVALRFLADEFNSAMKKKCSENSQNKEMYPHCVEVFNYENNTLLDLLKGCITSWNRSGGQKRQQKTDPPSKGIASSNKGAAGGAAKTDPPIEEGAAGGAAKADAPMQEGAPRRNREKRKFSWDEVHPDVVHLTEGIHMCQDEEMETYYKFLIENFGNPHGCKTLNNKAERVFLMDELLKRMYLNNMLHDVKMFPDEGENIKYFLRPERTWKVREDKIKEFNDAFRVLQDCHFGRYESSKGFNLKGTTACMDMFRALGFVPTQKAKAHRARFFRGPSTEDPTKMVDGEGNRKFSSRDCLYFVAYVYNTENVPKNLNHLWKDAEHKVRQCVKKNKRNLEVLLEAAQAVESESSSERAAQAVESESPSERASESNSLGYSCKRACFRPE